MLPNANLPVDMKETRSEREEVFPMQEQEQGQVCCETEKAASVIFTERLKESKAVAIAPVFIP
jgi:hypothetical protein